MGKKSAGPREIVLNQCLVRGASIHNADQRHARVEFTVAWDNEIRTEMGWDDVPENYGAVDLFGTLAIEKVMLVPLAPISKNGDMTQHAEELPATELGGFHVVPLKDKGGETVGHELRCTMKSQILAVAGRVARYVNKIGRAPGALTVTLADEEKQQTFDTE